LPVVGAALSDGFCDVVGIPEGELDSDGAFDRDGDMEGMLEVEGMADMVGEDDFELLDDLELLHSVGEGETVGDLGDFILQPHSSSFIRCVRSHA
jgi:hypothetical protein